MPNDQECILHDFRDFDSCSEYIPTIYSTTNNHDTGRSFLDNVSYIIHG